MSYSTSINKDNVVHLTLSTIGHDSGKLLLSKRKHSTFYKVFILEYDSIHLNIPLFTWNYVVPVLWAIKTVLIALIAWYLLIICSCTSKLKAEVAPSMFEKVVDTFISPSCKSKSAAWLDHAMQGYVCQSDVMTGLSFHASINLLADDQSSF